MIKQILVGLGGTPFTPVAIRRAVLLAQSQGASITGVTIVDPRRIGNAGLMIPGASGEIDSLRPQCQRVSGEQIEEAIAELEAACRAASVKCRLHRETGDAFSAMIDLARYHDVIVFGLRSVFEHDLSCPDPEALVLRLVMAGVRPMIAVSNEFRTISRVLIAYNGSMDAAKAMKHFVQLRLWPDARLKIMTFNSSDSEATKLAVDAAQYCQAHGFNVDWQTNPGDPSVLLLASAALWQADMIVMGNGARSVFLRRALGDTALEAIRRSPIPLFLCQ